LGFLALRSPLLMIPQLQINNLSLALEILFRSSVSLKSLNHFYNYSE